MACLALATVTSRSGSGRVKTGRSATGQLFQMSAYPGSSGQVASGVERPAVEVDTSGATAHKCERLLPF
jgi:hypothetical protein